MQTGDANYENNLIVQIYVSAAKDYAKALINNDLYEELSNRLFLVSGSFGINPETGKYIVDKLPVEISIAKNMITSFLASDSEQMYLNQRKVVIWIMKMIVDKKYSNVLKVKSKNIPWGKKVFYLVKKGCKDEKGENGLDRTDS